LKDPVLTQLSEFLGIAILPEDLISELNLVGILESIKCEGKLIYTYIMQTEVYIAATPNLMSDIVTAMIEPYYTLEVSPDLNLIPLVLSSNEIIEKMASYEIDTAIVMNDLISQSTRRLCIYLYIADV
jgi:hypothetical protein